MKRLSLKIKLTLLYTFFMVLATCAVLAILLSLSNREILAGAQSKLERRVQDSADDVTLEDGGLRVDSDFYSVTQDVYLSLYTEDMYFLYGRVPYGFDVQPEIADGRTRRIAEGNTDWYVYDMSFRLAEDYTVYLRGITSVTDAEASFGVTIRFAVILFPLMALVTAVIGYRFTRRTLLPVKQITRTVQKIRADADLSRRIGLKAPEGRERRNRDEIYGLAGTFDDMLEELEEVFQREKQFTSDVSHELRTPISVILAQCAECLEDEGLTARQREQLLLIERKAKDMAGMISQLLFLSRADQGRQPLQREPVNVSELTLMTAEEQQLLADAEGRGVRISCDAGSDITACVDETLFIRLLVNLISNAVSYSIGISEEDLPHIWERFYRADASRQPGGHSGLGLSMVKWIAEAHGGSVEAESRLGEGSTFTFHMPAGEPEEKN